MKTYSINDNGLETIKTRLDELSLDWSVEGTAHEIWMAGDFDDDLNNNGCYSYEIINRHGSNHFIDINLSDVDTRDAD